MSAPTPAQPAAADGILIGYKGTSYDPDAASGVWRCPEPGCTTAIGWAGGAVDDDGYDPIQDHIRWHLDQAETVEALGFKIRERVRVANDFDVEDLAGATGTITGPGKDANGRYVEVLVDGIGSIGFLPAELERVDEATVNGGPAVQAWPGDDVGPAAVPALEEGALPTLVVVPPQASRIVGVEDLPDDVMVRRAVLRGEFEGEVAQAARRVLDDLREVTHLLAAALGYEAAGLGCHDGGEGRDARRSAVAGLGLRERGLPGRREARGLEFVEGQNGVVAIKRDLRVGGHGKHGGPATTSRDGEHGGPVGPIGRGRSGLGDEVEHVREVREALSVRREVDDVPVDVERSSHVDSSSVVPDVPPSGDDATVEVAGDTPGVDSSTRGVTEELGADGGDPGEGRAACSCTPLVGDRHARACELYDGWAE